MEKEKTIPASRKQIILRGVKISLLVYSVIGIAVFHLQEKFMFHPTALEPGAAFSFSEPHKEVNIKVDEETNYNVVQFTTTGTPKGVVLYFHGNMENINHYAGISNSITSKDYEVWMIDYPTFGKSTGQLTEEAMYTQALQLYKMSRSRFQPSDIIIYGRSMGSGVAAQLASIRDCKRLILETPYYSLPSLASRYFWMYPLQQMIRFKLPTNQYLTKVTAPVTIFHGTEDGVIPYSHAEQLKEVLKKEDEFVTITGGSHNDLSTYPQLQQKMNLLLQQNSVNSSTTSL